jgi:hypothetical protein
MEIVMVDYFVYEIDSDEIIGSGPRKLSKEAIFVAYSFKSQSSCDFRVTLEQNIGRSPSLSYFDVLDGRVDVGKSWPTEIRNRLKRSRVIVADLTSLSPEVLFECGLAWGLGKPILPVTERPELLSTLPRWLTDLQVGHFSSDIGWEELLNSLSHHIEETTQKHRRAPSSGANPRSIVLLKTKNSIYDMEQQVRQTSSRFGMDLVDDENTIDALENISSDLASRVAHCSLLVAPLQNYPSDSFIHFACGVIVSKPTAGASSRRLNRRILLVVANETESNCLPADMARRVSDTIKIVTHNILAKELTNYGQLFQRWFKRQEY